MTEPANAGRLEAEVRRESDETAPMDDDRRSCVNASSIEERQRAGRR